MARKAPKNPINDIVDTVGAWFGGNRGSVPSSGAGAAWQASARSAAQSANRRIVKGVEEGVVQFGALGMGTSAQTQRDLMYGVSGAGTQALKEAAVSQVTGLAAGAVAAKTAQVAGRAVAKTGIPARVANKLTGQEVLIHSSPIKNLSRIEPKISTDLTRLEPNKALTFGVRSSAKGSRNYVGQYAEEITSWRSTTATGLAGKPQSVYITKTPSKNVTPYQFQGMWGRTPSSQRVVKEIPIENKTVDQLAREIASASRRAGRPLRKEKNIVEDIRFKAAKASSRRKNKNNQIGPAID